MDVEFDLPPHEDDDLVVDEEKRRTRRVILAAVAGLGLVASAWSVRFAWWDWAAAGRWLYQHAIVVALAGGGTALAGVAGLELRRGRRRAVSAPRPPLSWWTIAAGSVLIALVGWVTTTWLLNEADQSRSEARPLARVEAIKTGLGIAAGAVGALALLLAVRRQWHQEHTAEITEHDATERRITELYTKASDQLGSDKAPVRLAGLYALERLAQDNPRLRQTVVNVLCAYLRMPFPLPLELPGETQRSRRYVPAKPPQVAPGDVAPTDDLSAPVVDTGDAEWHQEREVRSAAQRLLISHLQRGSDPGDPVETFWADIDIDLTGAILIHINLTLCTLRRARFGGATFVGDTWFTRTTFTGNARFPGVTFTSTAGFTQASFAGGGAGFDGAVFSDAAWFTGTTFGDAAWFDGAVFSDAAWFTGTTFTSTARLTNATFTGTAEFNGANFAGDTWFTGVTFTGKARFTEAAAPKTRIVGDTTRSPWTSFTGAQFAQGVPAQVARFVPPPSDEGDTSDGD